MIDSLYFIFYFYCLLDAPTLLVLFFFFNILLESITQSLKGGLRAEIIEAEAIARGYGSSSRTRVEQGVSRASRTRVARGFSTATKAIYKDRIINFYRLHQNYNYQNYNYDYHYNRESLCSSFSLLLQP